LQAVAHPQDLPLTQVQGGENLVDPLGQDVSIEQAATLSREKQV
jgi:hypothetical protein